MNESSVLIENIRVALNATGLVPMDVIQRYANLYAEACTDLNERMQRCIPYIRNGNFTEAVRLAEIEPPISEVFATLDFAERDAWIEVCQLLGFPVPPPLLYDLSQELNTSYTKHASIDSLLRQHRILALNDAPLPHRIVVLRAIAKEDAGNTFWAEDVEKYERARMIELDEQVRTALAQNDVAQLNALQSELTSKDWTLPPPMRIVRSILSATLKRYAAELIDANNEFDIDRGRSIYGAIQNLLSSNRLSMNANIEQLIEPAVRWLDEENAKARYESEFQQSLYAMQEALDSHERKPLLESCYYALSRAATQSGNNIPPSVEQHFRETIAAYDLASSRRMKFVLLSTLCATILVAAVVVFAIRFQILERKIAAHETYLQQLATDQRFEEMPGAIENIHAKIASHPKIVDGIGQLTTLLEQDKDRAKDFVRYLTQAQASLENGTLDRSALSQAENLKRTQAEKTDYLGLKEKFDTKIAAEKAEIDKRFNEELTLIDNDFRAELNDATRPPKEILKQLNDLLRRTNGLNITDVQPAYVAQRDTLAAEIKKAHDGLETVTKQDDALRDFSKYIGEWDRYKSGLSSFLSTYGKQHPDAPHFKAVLDELDTISDVGFKIKSLTSSYNLESKDILSFQRNVPSYAHQLQTLEGLLSEPQTDLPLLFPAKSLVDLFSKTVPFDKNTAFRETQSIVRILMRKEVYPMILNNNDWYYFSKDPYTQGQSRFPYVTSPSSTSKESFRAISDTDRSPEKKLNGSQYEFSQQTQRALDSLSGGAGSFPLQTLKKILDTNGIDPILKILLLNAMLKDTAKFDPFYASRMESPLSIIKSCGIDESTDWMDVSSKTMVSTRKLAENTLGRLENLLLLAHECEADKDKLPDTLRQNQSNFPWIGILARDNNGKIYVMCSDSAASATGDLYIFKQDISQKVRLINIGTISALNNAANRPGTPVFTKN